MLRPIIAAKHEEHTSVLIKASRMVCAILEKRPRRVLRTAIAELPGPPQALLRHCSFTDDQERKTRALALLSQPHRYRPLET
jgi:hypothetical protein